jgi:hypothetical protein
MPLSLLANLIQCSEQTRFAKQRYSESNWQFITSTDSEVRIKEDQSFDSETFHGPETVSWLALAGGAGTLQARAI